jgi:hypothetical protein
MKASFAVAIFVATSIACYQSAAAPTGSEDHTNTTARSVHENPAGAMTFEELLEIARSRSGDAKVQIEKARDQSDDASVRMLATRILSLWNDEQNTFFSKTPALLDPKCLDVESLRERYREPIEAKQLIFEIRVGANGRAVRVESVKGTDDRALQDAVTHVLMDSRFLPVKEGDHYLDGTLMAKCRLEVR